MAARDKLDSINSVTPAMATIFFRIGILLFFFIIVICIYEQLDSFEG
jgi:hypothetical protein